MRLPRFLLLLGALAVLLAPAGSAVAQEASGDRVYYAYVASESDDEVSLVRFDGAAATVADRVPVGSRPTEHDGPHGLTVAPDGDHWFLSVAHGTPFGRVVKYETGTNRRLGAVEVGMFPATMEVSTATGLLYVANFNLHGEMEPSTVSVVDPAAMVEVEQIETGPMPHGSRLSPDGRRHYSVAMMSGTLFEIDAASMRVTRTLRTGADGAKPTWVQPHPNKPLAYVANNGADEVVEVDLEDWTVRRRFATGAGTNPYNLEVSPDGTTLVVTYKGSAETGIWDLEAGTETAVVPNTRPVSHGVVISPDGRYAFVSAEGIGGEPGAVDVVDIGAAERVASVAVGKQAGGIAFWKTEAAPASAPSAAQGGR
jgi:DNA-binding beta-propeller fold protein YncE